MRKLQEILCHQMVVKKLESDQNQFRKFKQNLDTLIILSHNHSIRIRFPIAPYCNELLLHLSINKLAHSYYSLFLDIR